MKKYHEIRDSLQTGDIVLFSGSGIVSEGIKKITNSKWSHVGMVLNFKEAAAVFLWESTTLSNVHDAFDGKAKRGVQLVLFSERIMKYKGDIAVRHLDYNFSKEELDKLYQFRNAVKNRPYEESNLELIKSAYDGVAGDNVEDLSSLFCSELIAEAYQIVGLLPQDHPSNEYTPADFSSKGKLNLLKGAKLSAEIKIQRD